ncbi:hypothetical protein MTQ01_12670 [Streptomyces sp. XM4193]|uniref:helix-turn-helix domain-containing protein n=1 Tax=Streptomyces sp. XM4193 TaxID=2929782 RepID=UPI001FFBDCDF|nr:hypothetical protein [Streptomyces sp. XM4193]MCK1796854.1 hypothetical protein [Streptomyces sp. XM4193]
MIPTSRTFGGHPETDTGSDHSAGADGELRARAVALRRAGFSRREIRDRLGVPGNSTLTALLAGEPPPVGSRRPNAKDELRARARGLRAQGRTYDEITAALGVSKSSVSLWVRDLPKPPTPPERLRRMSEARWGPHRAERARERERVRVESAAEVGLLSDRELFLVGVGLYWAEGAKSKPHRPSERVRFVNSDPGMIALFLRWLDLLGVERERLTFRLMIHERADVAAAERYWAEEVGVAVSRLAPTTLKRHNPKTGRGNTGENYRGCFVVTVLKSADLYRRIEGWWCGIVGAANSGSS